MEKPRRFGCSLCLGCGMERRVAGSQGHQHQAPHQGLLALCLRARRSLQCAKTWRRSGERRLLLKRALDRAESGSAPSWLVLLPARGCGRRRELRRGVLELWGLQQGTGLQHPSAAWLLSPTFPGERIALDSSAKRWGFPSALRPSPEGPGAGIQSQAWPDPKQGLRASGCQCQPCLRLPKNCCVFGVLEVPCLLLGS